MATDSLHFLWIKRPLVIPMVFDLAQWHDAVSHFSFLKCSLFPWNLWQFGCCFPVYLYSLLASFAYTSFMHLSSLDSIPGLLFFSTHPRLPCLISFILVTLLLSVSLAHAPLLISRPVFPTAYPICLSGPQSQISKIEFSIFISPYSKPAQLLYF